MRNEAPLFEVTFDASHLDFDKVFLLIWVQFFYWEPSVSGSFFSGSVQLSRLNTSDTVRSTDVRRPLTAPYIYFCLYIFHGELLPLSANGSSGKDDEEAQENGLELLELAQKVYELFSTVPSPDMLPETLAKLSDLIPIYLSQFNTTNAGNLVIPHPHAPVKIQLSFFPNGTLDNKPVTATQAKAEISYLNTSNQLLKLFEYLSDDSSLGVPRTFTLNAERRQQLVKIYKDDPDFFLRVNLSFDIEAGKGKVTQIGEGPFNVSSLLPGIFLMPGLTLYSLEIRPRHIQWVGSEGSAAVQLVIAVVTLNEVLALADDQNLMHVQHYSFPSVILSALHSESVYRTIMVKNTFTVTFTWVAYYYFSDGQVIMIGNPSGQSESGVQLTLPPLPISPASDDWTSFVILENNVDTVALPHVLQQY